MPNTEVMERLLTFTNWKSLNNRLQG